MIFKITTIIDVLSHINPAEKPLILFDIDKTLIIPANDVDLEKMVFKALMKKLCFGVLPLGKMQEEIMHEILNDAQFTVQTVEPTTAHVIQTLQTQKLIVQALTARFPSVAESTCNHLTSVNINFAHLPLHQQEIAITDDGATIFKDGIIFCSRIHDKGPILMQFLAKIGLEPNKIVLIDDEEHHINSVAHAVGKHLIPFVGICYKPR